MPFSAPDAPEALVEHCRRAAPKPASSISTTGQYDAGDVAALVAWLNERGEFEHHDEWMKLGAALRLAMGDGGLEIWQSAHDSSVTESVETSKWRSFATEPEPGCVTLSTFMKRAHAAGWAGTLRRSTSSMFSGVAEMVAAWQRGETWSPSLAPTGPLPDGVPRPGPCDIDGDEEEEFTQVAIEDFLAYLPMNQYIHVPTRALWPAATINTTLAPVQVGTKEVKKRDSDEVEVVPVTIPASKHLNRTRGIACMTWAPGYPMVMHGTTINGTGWIKQPGSTTFNEYRGPTIEHVPGDPSPYVDHVRLLCGEHADHVLYYFAHRVQRPAEKINHALVFGGSQGIGKDTMFEPLKAAIGPWNFKEASPVTMMGQFDPYKKSVVLRVNEARDLGDMTRNEFYDRLKNLAAAPPDSLPVNEKYVGETYVPNVCGMLVTTNYKDAIAVPPDDRRCFVIWSDLTKEDFTEQYWISLYAWFANGGNEIVADYLARLDLSGFNHKAYPLRTEAWHQMVGFSAAPEDAELADAIDKLGNPDAITVGRIVQLLGEGNILSVFLRERRNSRSVPVRFKGCDYVPVRNKDARDGLWVVGKKRQVVYVKATLSERDRTAAARALAIPPLPY